MTPEPEHSEVERVASTLFHKINLIRNAICPSDEVLNLIARWHLSAVAKLTQELEAEKRIAGQFCEQRDQLQIKLTTLTQENAELRAAVEAKDAAIGNIQ